MYTMPQCLCIWATFCNATLHNCVMRKDTLSSDMMLWGVKWIRGGSWPLLKLNNRFSHVSDTFTMEHWGSPAAFFGLNVTLVPLYWKQPLLFFLSAATAAVTWRCGPSFRLNIICGGMSSANRDGRGENPARQVMLVAYKSWLSLKYFHILCCFQNKKRLQKYFEQYLTNTCCLCLFSLVCR